MMSIIFFIQDSTREQSRLDLSIQKFPKRFRLHIFFEPSNTILVYLRVQYLRTAPHSSVNCINEFLWFPTAIRELSGITNCFPEAENLPEARLF